MTDEIYYKKYKKYKNKLRYHQSGSGKEKSKHRSDPTTDPFKKILAFFAVYGFGDSVLGQECDWNDKSDSQKYNFVKRAFNNPVSKELISAKTDRPLLVVNIDQYQPVPGMPPSGHTLMFLKLDDGNYGTIGFYPHNYASMFGLLGSLFGGTKGLLATPDPIARKDIKQSENLDHIEVVYNGYLFINQSIVLSKYLESSSGSRKGIHHYSDDDLGNYQPIALGNSNNCLTFLNDKLGIPIGNTTHSLAVPNLLERPDGYVPEAPFLPIGNVMPQYLAPPPL